MLNISYFTRNVYGVQRIYIIGKPGEYLQRLTGRKTLDRSDLHSLSGLGFILKETADPLNPSSPQYVQAPKLSSEDSENN